MLVTQEQDFSSSRILSLPDLLAICNPGDVELPTLSMDSGQLNYLIDQYCTEPGPQQPVASIHLEPAGATGAEPSYHLSLQQPVIDPADNMNHFHGMNGSVTVSDQYNMMGQGHGEQKPHVRVVEQPKANSLRFRYQCEGRGAGALQGHSSTAEIKTFPKIQIVGYRGPAVVVVSCVTHDSDPPKAHPHNLVSPASVGRDGCKKGVCTMNVNNEDMTVEFQHLGIQCVRKKDVEDSLKQRKDIRVDPYRQTFKHMENPQSIDLNAVKLCFQAFLENPSTPGKYTIILPPVCSNPIYDAKAKKELQIMDISDTTSPVQGGKKIIILCEKVTREDIKVRFYDPEPGYTWEAWGELSAADVHKQYALSLKTPAFPNGILNERKRVYVELVKPSDETTSEPQEFFYLPSSDTPIHEHNINCPSPSNDFPLKTSPSVQHSPVYNNGNGVCITADQIKNERNCRTSVKQESIDPGWNIINAPQGSPLKTSTSSDSPETMTYYKNPYQAFNGMNGYHPGLQNHHDLHQHTSPSSYIPNIPPTSNQHCGNFTNIQHIPNMSPIHQQNSPDYQGIAELDINSTQYHSHVRHSGAHQLIDFDNGVAQISDKIEAFTVSDTIKVLTNMGELKGIQSGNKRSSKTAALESGSNIVPREMARIQTDLETPEVSAQLNTPHESGNLSNYNLVNCTKVNDI